MLVVTSMRLMAAYQVSALLTTCCMGMCPSVMTFEEPEKSGGFLYQGGKTSTVIWDKVCQCSLETSVPTFGTPNSSRSMGFYPAIPCLTELPYP